MRDYLHEYCKAQDALFKNKMLCIENHIHRYEILEKLLGFQYWVNGEVTNFVSKQNHDYFLDHFSELSVHLLFSYNVLSLDTSFKIMEQNMIHQSAVNIRTVYEGVPKMYYLAFFPDEVRMITLQENMEGITTDERQQYLHTEEASKILDGKIPSDTKAFVAELRRKYSPNWFREKIYSQNSVKKMREMYGVFSTSTHANITRNRVSSDYSEINTKQIFDTIHCLSYFNIHAEINGSEEILKDCNIFDESTYFIATIGKEIGYLIDAVYLFPDNESVIEKLKFPPEKEPWVKTKLP